MYNLYMKDFSVVVFLFILILFISAGQNSVKPMKSFTSLPYREAFNAFPNRVHGAASLQKEKQASQSTKGVLGIFEEDGLKASSLQSRHINDPVSNLPGKPQCVGSSNGLHNSTGSLCLTPEVMQQFRTRGGNQK